MRGIDSQNADSPNASHTYIHKPPTQINNPQCCGLVTDPTLLLIDEPTSGLDGYAALVVMRLLKAFTQKAGDVNWVHGAVVVGGLLVCWCLLSSPWW